MADAYDYRRRVGTILRVGEITSAVKEYTSRFSTGYPYLLEKRRVSLVEMEHSRALTAVFNPSPFHRTPKGSICLNFYTTFNKAKQIKPVQPQSMATDWHYRVQSRPIPGIKPVRSQSTVTWRCAAPDATIYLPITPRGIDIERARKELGLRAIAFITDVEPFRMVFNPADENWLSPLAVYTLSKEHTQPIKVFEPQPPAVIQSDVTANSRAQHFLFTLLSCTLDVIKLLLGFPETDGEHIIFLYGQRFANFYKFIGNFTGTLKFWMILAGCCSIFLMMFIDIRQNFHTMSFWFEFEARTPFIKMYKLSGVPPTTLLDLVH